MALVMALVMAPVRARRHRLLDLYHTRSVLDLPKAGREDEAATSAANSHATNWEKRSSRANGGPASSELAWTL